MSAKPKLLKSQINALGAEQLSEELKALNLDPDGGLGVKRMRLRAALYPNTTTSSQIPNLSQQESFAILMLYPVFTIPGLRVI